MKALGYVVKWILFLILLPLYWMMCGVCFLFGLSPNDDVNQGQ